MYSRKKDVWNAKSEMNEPLVLRGSDLNETSRWNYIFGKIFTSSIPFRNVWIWRVTESSHRYVRLYLGKAE